ncbi:unnamed protein product, partial [Mesorhabditis spiculigera]
MIASELPPQLLCQRYVLNDTQLSETFDLLDVDRDGQLSRAEIAALLRTVKVEPTRMELDFIFEEMDTNKTGKINKDEFVRYMRSPPVHRTTLQEMESQFKEFDRDGDGEITYEEMRRILQECSGLDDEKATREMFQATDRNGDGRISFLEFVAMMSE